MQPPGFIDKDHLDYVCSLRKSLYGLKQAPRAWYQELRDYLLSLGFYNSLTYVSLFIFSDAGTTLYILVYVDDIVVTGNNLARVDSIIALLGHRFSIKDLGPLYFFGCRSCPAFSWCCLSQRRYIMDLLTWTKMAASHPVRTPLATATSLRHDGDVPLSNGRDYHDIIGGLQYLALTRPDISYAVNKLSQVMQAPTTDHLNAAKRVLRYIMGTIDHGLLLHRQSYLSLHAYFDADWSGDKDDFSSTSHIKSFKEEERLFYAHYHVGSKSFMEVAKKTRNYR
ncbi:uncharacterized protein LOC109838237 [Asparagus officinalis]|uniref:uncharacterized protein LOC109838237 n=1 Tax=Asparagus officinalis TaxID=4686 RepID=UPI00098E431D|nr:uncharacterized protein LOC109838237 [Asparagus officinalis]